MFKASDFWDIPYHIQRHGSRSGVIGDIKLEAADVGLLQVA
jgi:hypothetical protein